mmetsp:Transcript_34273/g.108620  ORF Transcript_34273/g.108620 Transcript_34273/m.108620 type:complete len:280 (+) Transcript_34273:74-913(+)
MPALMRISSGISQPKMSPRAAAVHIAKDQTSPPIDVPSEWLTSKRPKAHSGAVARVPSAQDLFSIGYEGELFELECNEERGDCMRESTSRWSGASSCDEPSSQLARRLEALVMPSTSTESKIAEQVRWEMKRCEGMGLRGEDACVEVAAALNRHGYNARVVQSKAEKADYLRSMNHTFVLVYVCAKGGHWQPLVVDPAFRNQFTIARPTNEYEQLVNLVPHEFVGTMDRLSEVVEFLSRRLQESFKVVGMACPPWRERQALMSKWFSESLTSGAGAVVL